MPRRLSFPRLRLQQQPLLFIATSFIGGLLVAARWQLAPRTWLIALACVWIVSAIGWLSRWQNQTLQWLLTLWLLSGCFVAGATLYALQQAGTGPQRVRSIFERGELRHDEACEVWGTLDAMPELAPDRIYLTIAVERVAALGKEQAASGTVQMVVPFQDFQARLDYDALQLDYGSRVRVLGFLSNRGGYRNPGAPEFDELLEFRGFDASGWVKHALLIEGLGTGQRNRVLWRLYRLRARALAAILGISKQPATGILAAALLGNRYFLDRTTAQTFREGGTFHLLVISGLHVALIAAVLLWLTRWLRRERWLQFGVVTLCLWGYGLMVGAQPSIMRAVVMITVALVGQLLYRSALGANTLAGAALVLLAWQPRDLFNPAFQLSFLTVAAIVLLAAPVYERLRQVGVWQPNATTPYPPRTLRWVKWLAELLFWNEREFRQEMTEARIRYSLEKAQAARWLNRSRLQWPLQWIAATVFTTTCVQVALLPLMVVHFHRFSIVSPVTNVVEGVLVFALMLAGAGQLFVYALSVRAAVWLAPLVNWLGALTVKAGQWPLLWSRASVRMPDWGPGAAWVYGIFFALILLLILLVHAWHPLRKGDEAGAEWRRSFGRMAGVLAVSAIVVLSWLLIAHPFPHRFARGRLSVTFLDVGQGDAIFISFPHGQTMLLDSGGRLGYALRQEQGEGEPSEDIFIEDRISVGEAAVLPFLWQLGLKRLDYIAATHGDSDHTEAFAEVIHALSIGQALAGSVPRANERPDLFTRAVRARGLPLRLLKRGEMLNLDGARLEVLSPFADAGEVKPSDNNASLVLRLTLGQRAFLLTGDIEKETEARLVASGELQKADVLKVAHHGSRTSTTAAFLARVQPQHAIISAGNPSPFGHPHPEVVARLRAANVQLWQTSRCGAITISTDGADLQVGTFVKCAP
ncbi:MAG: ComEC/Rec2 family competence protein [Acidobacteria bacterium]|nr:ComEC/Rec2 family competence protein [Acidobacteriota bacterium]MBI3424240.1 ComEC/Rec2 family competence protein [Acidobacteriota bacterium]